MISRRTLLLLLGSSGLLLGPVAGQYMPDLHPLANDKDALPPHNDALLLVWRTQQEAIRKLELQHASAAQKKQKEYVSAAERWWFDTDNRQWKVSRDVSPGVLDSTHWFSVSYVIDGNTVGSWFVGQVQ